MVKIYVLRDGLASGTPKMLPVVAILLPEMLPLFQLQMHFISVGG
jgi:hypothetical protein